jgi:hypothetical protein
MRRFIVPAATFTVAIIAVLGTARLSAQQAMTEELRYVVLNNAPYIIAETSQNFDRPPSSVDHLLAVDFDNDFYGSNNSANARNGYIPQRIPTVYYSIEETTAPDGTGYYYIGYYFYHPNDDGFSVGPASSSGHEHDMEGIFLIVRKTSWTLYGTPVLAWSQAHGALIPYFNEGFVNPNTALAQGDELSWGGKINFRVDPDFNIGRPVAVIAQSTHGTYMAQACGPYASGLYVDGFGYNTSTSGTNNFGSCVHVNRWAIIYQPAIDSYPFVGLADWENANIYNYRLVELATSPIWQHRGPGVLLYGSGLWLGHSQYGAEFFVPSSGSGEAKPPWAWLGGPGSHFSFAGHGGYWYTFREDGTQNAHGTPMPWPSFLAGELLIAPQDAAYRFFPNYGNSGFSEPVVFSAFY